ncbi:MAG: IS110 family transposase [Cyclonatronaceae bacterium]
MIYSIGCDIAKDEFVACFLEYELIGQRSRVQSRKTFNNNTSGARAFLKWLARNATDPCALIRCTMEATGIYYETLALHIHDHAGDVHLSVVLPSKAKSYLKSRGLRSKTDKIDAYGLALMGCERKLDAWKGIDPFWRELRQLTRTKTSLQHQISQLTNQLHAQRHSGIQVPEVQKMLKNLIKTLCDQKNRLNELIEQHLGSRRQLADRIDKLESIPGIGRQTIAVILAETLGFGNFTRVSQLMSYSGYDVVINQSGSRVGKQKISKQGSPFIRAAMYMPACTVLRIKPEPLIGYYNRLLLRHGIKMKSHVALQKKLLTYMYTLWNKQQYYDPTRFVKLQDIPDTIVASPCDHREATVDTSFAVACDVL